MQNDGAGKGKQPAPPEAYTITPDDFSHLPNPFEFNFRPAETSDQNQASSSSNPFSAFGNLELYSATQSSPAQAQTVSEAPTTDMAASFSRARPSMPDRTTSLDSGHAAILARQAMLAAQLASRFSSASVNRPHPHPPPPPPLRLPPPSAAAEPDRAKAAALYAYLTGATSINPLTANPAAFLPSTSSTPATGAMNVSTAFLPSPPATSVPPFPPAYSFPASPYGPGRRPQSSISPEQHSFAAAAATSQSVDAYPHYPQAMSEGLGFDFRPEAIRSDSRRSSGFSFGTGTPTPTPPNGEISPALPHHSQTQPPASWPVAGPSRVYDPPTPPNSKAGKGKGRAVESYPTPLSIPTNGHEVSFPSTLTPVQAAYLNYPGAIPVPGGILIESTSSPEAAEREVQRVVFEEDKRRRNTAASARFRAKKRQLGQVLQETAQELQDRVGDLEKEAEELRSENGWLRKLLLDSQHENGANGEEANAEGDGSGTGAGDADGDGDVRFKVDPTDGVKEELDKSVDWKGSDEVGRAGAGVGGDSI